MSGLSIQDISFTAPVRAMQMDTLQVPPRRRCAFRIPSTPEQKLRKILHARDVRLEFQLINFIQLVQSAKNGMLPAKKLSEICSRISTSLKTLQTYQFQLKRFELKPELITLFKEVFADLSIFLEQFELQKRSETISLEQLEDVDLDVDALADTIQDFLVKTPSILKQHNRSEDGEAPRKRARLESSAPLKITLTAPSGETKLLIEEPVPIVPSEADASLLLSINGST